jgi:hypothetical protein
MNEDDDVEFMIASFLDRPSVFMGGPSPGARRRARQLIESLKSGGYVVTKIAEKTE